MSKAQRTVLSSTLAASGRASFALTIIVDLTMILRVLSRLLNGVKYPRDCTYIYFDQDPDICYKAPASSYPEPDHHALQLIRCYFPGIPLITSGSDFV